MLSFNHSSPGLSTLRGEERARKLEEKKRWRQTPREQREEVEVWRIKGPTKFEDKYPLWKMYRVPGLEEKLSQATTPLDISTYAKMLKKCARERSLEDGQLVHQHIRAHSNENDKFLGHHLIQMYARCKSPEQARKVFDGIHQPNAFTWSIIVESYVRNDMHEEAWSLYSEMVNSGGQLEIDGYTISSMLTSCTKVGNVAQGRLVHKKARELGLEADIVVGTALIHLYAKCWCLEEAEDAFQFMVDAKVRDIVSVTAMIGAYVSHDRGTKALDIYWKMRAQGLEPDSFTYAAILGACTEPDQLLEGKHIHKHILESDHFTNLNVKNALITMYAKCNSLDDAKSVFSLMDVKDVISWNSMIAAYTMHGLSRDAFALFQRMSTLGHTPDVYTYSSMLGACTDPCRLEHGRELHLRITSRGFDKDPAMQNNIISMYTKCGSLYDARKFFDGIQLKQVGAWNTMLAAYSQLEKGEDALSLYRSLLLQGLRPDRFTFSSVIDSCASMGAFREGRAIHECSVSAGLDQGVVLGTAVVNMYARCGNLDEARRAFDSITAKDVVTWSAMIAANAQHGHGEVALELSHHMSLDGVLQNEVTASSVLHGCSHAGLLDEGLEYFFGLKDDFGILTNEGACVGLVDLLGRAGWLKEAEHVLNTMPFKASFVAMVTMLAACKVHGDMKRAKAVTKRVINLEPENPGPYMLLNNLYAAAGRWEDVAKVRMYMKTRGVKKRHGCSSIEYRGRMYQFTVNDTSNDRNVEMRAELERLYEEMRSDGYVPDTSEVFYDVSDDQKEELLKFHSEKLAMGFGLVTSPPGSTLRIIKNLRVCADCHTVGKLTSKLRNREIVVRDGTRFHHFKNGVCSCGDYW